MLKLAEEFSGQINFVLLNVDNLRGQQLIDDYEVNGIPQLNFFDKNCSVFSIVRLNIQ